MFISLLLGALVNESFLLPLLTFRLWYSRCEGNRMTYSHHRFKAYITPCRNSPTSQGVVFQLVSKAAYYSWKPAASGWRVNTVTNDFHAGGLPESLSYLLMQFISVLKIWSSPVSYTALMFDANLLVLPPLPSPSLTGGIFFSPCPTFQFLAASPLAEPGRNLMEM